MIKIFTALAVLTLLTIPAVSAQQYWKQAPPKAHVSIFCPQGKDIVYTERIQYHYTQVGTTAVFFDESTGQVLWKKWYVNGKLVSTSTAPYIYYKFKFDKKTAKVQYFTVNIKVANNGGSAMDPYPKVVTVTQWDPNLGKP
jgi:hypothetical protein